MLNRFVSRPIVVLTLHAPLLAIGPAVDTPSDTSMVTFMDSVMVSIMDASHVPGAVFVVVKDGQIQIAQGYGQADLNSGTAVDAGKTLFRIASITKPFTALAILQLVEQNLLNLDEDIRDRLPFPLKTSYDQPITLRDLLTHTSGFEISDIGDAARDPGGVLTLTDMAANHMTAQANPPGRRYHYSNHNYLLAGVLIEQVAGIPYEVYLRDNIFVPLGMDYISAEQPLPDSLDKARTAAYDWSGDAYEVLPLDYSQVAPADVLQASGLAVSRLMLALLGAHQAGTRSVLSERSRALMMQVQFHHHPLLQNGWTLGLRESTINGRMTVGHSGGQLGFTSQMHLFPNENLGIFVALNRRAGNARFNMVQAFMNRYYPEETPDISPLLDQPDVASPGDAGRLTGRYLNTGFAITGTLEKAATIAGRRGRLWIGTDSTGALTISETRMLPRGDGIYVTETGRTVIFFEEDPTTGKMFAYFRNVVYEKFPEWMAPKLHRTVLNSSLIVFTLLQVGLVIAFRRRKSQMPPDSGRLFWSRALKSSSLGSIGLVGGWTMLFLVLTKDIVELDYGTPWVIYLLLTFLLAGAVSMVLVLYSSFVSWRSGIWHPLARLAYSAVALGLLILALLAYHYNLLGYYVG